jgi:EAL domain-containing protein (putative c-di-GMP-specific phosphodiesterase class I)
MVRSINSMAHELGILTIAEGIEDEATAEVMRRIGVDWGQGYYWGRPEIEA